MQQKTAIISTNLIVNVIYIYDAVSINVTDKSPFSLMKNTKTSMIYGKLHHERRRDTRAVLEREMTSQQRREPNWFWTTQAYLHPVHVRSQGYSYDSL